MMKKLLSLVAVALLTLSFAGSVFADQIQGKITKVGGEGREITVKSKDKEVTVKVSGSRTKMDGIGDRGELKEGQNVTVEFSGDEATKLSVQKAK